MHDLTRVPTAEGNVDRLSIPADRRELARLEQFLEHFASAYDVNLDEVRGVWVAVHEIVTNAIEHGYRGDLGSIEIALWWEGASLIARVRDTAPLFDPTCAPSPDPSLAPDQCRAGGMGIHMARQFVDEMRYRITPDGQNEVLLIKHGVVRRAEGGVASLKD